MADQNGVRIKSNAAGLKELADSLYLLANVEVLVGFPEDTTARDGESITNAALGYIHDNGEPAANIPARPFMVPGIESVMPGLRSRLVGITNDVIKRGKGALAVEQGLHSVGLEAKLAIQNKIEEGVPPPLADSTLRVRARKRPNRIGPGLELLSRSHGIEPSMDFVIPLVDTGEMRDAVSYVIRSRKKRRK